MGFIADDLNSVEGQEFCQKLEIELKEKRSKLDNLVFEIDELLKSKGIGNYEVILKTEYGICSFRDEYLKPNHQL